MSADDRANSNLVCRARDGDEAALESLIARHLSALRNRIASSNRGSRTRPNVGTGALFAVVTLLILIDRVAC
jgi:hypothetical protein